MAYTLSGTFALYDEVSDVSYLHILPSFVPSMRSNYLVTLVETPTKENAAAFSLNNLGVIASLTLLNSFNRMKIFTA